MGIREFTVQDAFGSFVAPARPNGQHFVLDQIDHINNKFSLPLSGRKNDGNQ